MGNSKPPPLTTTNKKKKKKGRPSLLDLQKRSLRLQQQQQLQQRKPNSSNPNPNPNPYRKFPPSAAAGGRRPTRRNPNSDLAIAPASAGDDDDDDEEDEDENSSAGRRREKKLKLVLRLPHHCGDSSAASDSDSGGGARRKRRIDAVGDRDETERRNSASKATDAPPDPGPTTPLPDKKLLLFILDRLQKKDTYGVFAEPVDPEELPDYHDIIDHPMDFSTVRKKLDGGAYATLEQFEDDVFLISSNAMTYNAPDTIYYRQARAIQELAKKDFENLRQESDDNEPEPKPVRRGRPPSKKSIKQTVGRPSAERTSSEFSDATLANAGDNGQRSGFHDKTGTADVPTRAYALRNTETNSWTNEHKLDKYDDYTGSGMKGLSAKYGKKLSVIDENRRNTYKDPQLSTSVREPSVLSTFDGERKPLVPVGLHLEHAYARSLARFAANLGPVGWEIAAKRIQRMLPPGTKFGPGWIGDDEAPQQSQLPLPTTSPHSSERRISLSNTMISTTEPTSADLTVEDGRTGTALPLQAPAPAVPNRSTDSVDGMESKEGASGGSRFNMGSAGNVHGIRAMPPFQLRPNPSLQQPIVNGFNARMGFNLPSQAGKMIGAPRPPGSFGADATMMHGHTIRQAPANQLITDDAKSASNLSSSSNSGSPMPDPGHDSQAPWRRGFSLNQRPDSFPPDLNVGFQSPRSPVSGMLIDSQQPDLALQL